MQNSARVITQTRGGYLWIGTFAGLARFDGVKFTIFNTDNTPALSSNLILALYEDRQGALWIGTDGQGLVKYAQGRFAVYNSADASVEWINRIWEDEAGKLLLLARHRPLQFKDGRFSQTTAYYELGDQTRRVLAVTRDGGLWTFIEGGIGRYRAGAWTNYPLAGSLGMTFGAEARDGSLWVSTECCGLRRFGQGEPEVIGATPNEMFYRDRHGELRQLQLARLLGAANEAVEQNELLAEVNSGLAQTNEQLNQTNDSLAEANLHLDRANADLLATLDRLRLGVVIADASGEISFVSAEARRLLGEPAATAVGRRWVEVLPLRPTDLAQLQALCKIAPAQRAKLPVELKLEGGRHYWVEIEVQDDPRENKRKIFCFYDVTEVYDLRSLLDEEAQFLGMIGHSPAMQMVYKQINNLAPVNTTVLIEGETGVGKELAARAIHQASARRKQPFIAVNSASLTESVLASQLFGHRRGAFTGATADHKGLFEEAHKGTIFLDEIGDLPLGLQASLLRVLQEGEIMRLGESRPRRVDVRVLAATNRDLTQAVAEGRFREDLFYRICVARLSLPPLRERREDIPLLASVFLKQASAATGKEARDISREALEHLLAYDWPGNVRELKSAIEVALINCRGGVIQASDLQPMLTSATLSAAAPNLVSKQRLQQALAQTNGNRAAAARLLGISRTPLYHWLNELGME